MSASSWLLGGLIVFGVADVVAIDLVIGPRALDMPPAARVERVASATPVTRAPSAPSSPSSAPPRAPAPAPVPSPPPPPPPAASGTVPESTPAAAAAIAPPASGTVPESTAPVVGVATASAAPVPAPAAPVPASGAVAVAAAPAAPTSEARLAPRIAPVVIHFATDRDALDDAAARALDTLADELTGAPDVAVEIVGHADVRGTEHHNEELSVRRMRRVRDYLIGRGLDAARLHGRAVGAREPARPGDSEAALAANRRVEIRRTP